MQKNPRLQDLCALRETATQAQLAAELVHLVHGLRAEAGAAASLAIERLRLILQNAGTYDEPKSAGPEG